MVARVTVSLPEDLLSRVDDIADERGETRSDVVREAAATYVSRYEQGIADREREAAVAEGVEWLRGIAAQTPVDARPSLEILRELREGPAEGAPIEPSPGDAR